MRAQEGVGIAAYQAYDNPDDNGPSGVTSIASITDMDIHIDMDNVPVERDSDSDSVSSDSSGIRMSGSQGGHGTDESTAEYRRGDYVIGWQFYCLCLWRLFLVRHFLT